MPADSRDGAPGELDVQLRLIDMLSATGAVLVRGGGMPQVLQAFCQALVDHLDAAFARVWVVHPGEDVLRLEASAGMYTHVDGRHGRIKIGELEIGQIAASGAPFLTNDVPNEAGIEDREWARREGMVSLAGHPLRAEDRVVGVLAMFSRRRLPELVIRVLAPLADTLAQYVAREFTAQALRESEELYRHVFVHSPDGLLMVEPESGIVTEANPAAVELYGGAGRRLAGLRLGADLHPEHAERVGSALTRAAQRGDAAVWAERTGPGGERAHLLLQMSRLSYGGAPRVLVVVRDQTQQVAARELLERRVGERTAEIASLLEIAGQVTRNADLSSILDVILERLGEVVEFDAGLFLVRRNASQVMLLAGYRGPRPPEDLTGREIEFGEDLSRPSDSDRMPPALRGLALLGSGSRAASWLVLPIRLADRLTGALVLARRGRSAFDQRSVGLAAAVATQAGIAIENDRLIGEAWRAAAVEERARLARDLHDAVSQSLSSVSLNARAALRALESGRSRNGVSEALARVLESADASIAELHALIMELWPETLGREGLIAAIRGLGAALESRSRVAVEYEMAGEPDLDAEAKHALYRIAQEALNNVLKHSGATRVKVGLRREGGDWQLTVADAGRGFAAEAVYVGRFGLESMRRRAESLGWRFELRSSPGSGTEVVVTTRRSPSRLGSRT